MTGWVGVVALFTDRLDLTSKVCNFHKIRKLDFTTGIIPINNYYLIGLMAQNLTLVMKTNFKTENMNALVYNHPYRHHRFNRNHNTGEERECRVSPSYNISETEEAFRVELAVPGFSKKDIKIDLEKDMLRVYSDREIQNGEVEYRVKQFGNHNFSKSFILPKTVDSENIKADYKNGILSLTLPKKEEVRVKKQIQVS